ncbi:MAG: hypothetical protein K8I82_02230 [Anaerolineae bacterium]|nr:hypothetical protein [Anaerolineae bacterium]
MARKRKVTPQFDAPIEIAVNAGNLSTNGSIRISPDEIVTLSFPSIRSRASGYTLNLESEIDREWVAYGKNGTKFYVGEDVLVGLESRKAIDTHTGEKRYGSDLHLFLIDYTTALLLKKLQEYGTPESEIEVVLNTFLPPGLYEDFKPKIKAAFTGKSAARAIQFKSDAEPMTWRVSQVNVFPEGLHTWSCMYFNDSGARQSQNITSGIKVLMDGGGWSFDDYLIINGRVDPESLKNATLKNGGIIHHVLNTVLDDVITLGGSFRHTTIYDIDKVLRDGSLSGHYRLTVGNDSVDIKTFIGERQEEYARFIARNVCDRKWNGFDEVDGFIFIGGGFFVIGEALDAMYPGKLVRFDSYDHLADVLPTEMDVVGALRAAEYERRRRELQAGAK